MGGLWRAPCKGAPGRNVNDLDAAQPTVPLKDLGLQGSMVFLVGFFNRKECFFDRVSKIEVVNRGFLWRL